MTVELKAGLIRAVSLFAPVLFTLGAWFYRRPSEREKLSALLATFWNMPALLFVNLLAIRMGWWSFQARGGAAGGVPVDLWLGWAILWGFLPVIALPGAKLVVLAASALALDVVYMPALSPVLQLGPAWLVGEALAIALCLVPGQLLAHWTAASERLYGRALLQVVCFAGFFLGVPWVVVHPPALSPHPAWLGLLGCAAVPGLAAVREFAVAGRGTPVPFDPPRNLVTTGPYAYLRNPMQLSQCLVFVFWGLTLQSFWIMLLSLSAFFYSIGFARGDESLDLRERFGEPWLAYRCAVRNWVPRWRPYRRAAARVYLAEGCGMCNSLERWLRARGPAAMEFAAAERHPARCLERMTYDPCDGSAEESGVAALGRVLEHINLAWAAAGWALRLPGVCQVAQLVADTSGAGPRPVSRTY